MWEDSVDPPLVQTDAAPTKPAGDIQHRKDRVVARKQAIRNEDRLQKQDKEFDKYFDEVHEDFLVRLKEKHPDLTPKDLRMCAYLKMNISTKEIAPLMNISVRGVEISRYRLRRKLNIEQGINLTEYILSNFFISNFIPL